MRLLKFILVVFVVAPLLLYGAVKVYLYYQLSEYMDRVSARSNPFVNLEYGDVSTSLSGEASVHDLRILVMGTDDVVEINKVTYNTPNIWYLLRDLGEIDNNQVPMSLHLSIQGLSMDLYGDLTDKMEDAINNINLDLIGVNTLCGGRLFIGPREYRDMGYDEIVVDGDIGYDADSITQEIALNMDFTVRNMGTVHLSTIINGFNGTAFATRVSRAHNPRVGIFKLNYSDNSYHKRFVKMCSELSKMSEAEFITAEVNQSPAYFANLWGIVPGPGLRDAYKEFLSDPGTIDVTLQWPDAIEPQNLQLYKPQDIPELLNLTLAVNNKPVSDLSFNFYNGKTLDVSNRFTKLLGSDGRPEAKPVKKKTVKYKERYYPIAPSSLSKYVGEDVRLVVKGDMPRDGRLIRMNGNIAYVQKRLSGGNYTMQVATGRIKKAEVLLKRPPR